MVKKVITFLDKKNIEQVSTGVNLISMWHNYDMLANKSELS